MSSVVPATSGNPDFRLVYRRTLPDVYGYLLGLVGGNTTLADDLLAETYLSAAKRFAEDRAAEVTVPWLKVVAKRRLIDHLRRESSMSRKAERLRQEMQVRSSTSTQGFVGDSATPLAEQDDVYQTLSKLTGDQRLVLILRHVDGYSTKEIAEQIGRTPKAVEGLLARARAAFRQIHEESHV